MSQVSPGEPKHKNGHTVKIRFKLADGRWKHGYLNKPEYAKYDEKRGVVVNSMYLESKEDNQYVYTLQFIGGVELTNIPEDCIGTDFF